MTELNNKAIKIQGKSYVLVSDRVLEFNRLYPNGMIQTKLLSDPSAEMVVMMAKVTPFEDKPDRYFTGYSQATWGEGMVNKTAAMENCETSAVGRALGFMGIGVIESIASADEVHKAQSQPAYTAKTVSKPISDLTAHCSIHDAEMQERTSSKTGKHYFSHIVDGSHCFGKPTDNPKTVKAVAEVNQKSEDISDKIPF